jgi:hypothetical protein
VLTIPPHATNWKLTFSLKIYNVCVFQCRQHGKCAEIMFYCFFFRDCCISCTVLYKTLPRDFCILFSFWLWHLKKKINVGKDIYPTHNKISWKVFFFYFLSIILFPSVHTMCDVYDYFIHFIRDNFWEKKVIFMLYAVLSVFFGKSKRKLCAYFQYETKNILDFHIMILR